MASSQSFPNARSCPQVLSSGTCNDPQCPFEHNVRNCDLCSLVFETDTDYKAHLTTKQHLNKTQGETGALLFCSICEKYVSGTKNWTGHVRSVKHASRAQSQGRNPEVDPEEPEQVPDHQFCSVCNQHIHDRYWARHPSMPRHKDREQFLAFRSVVEEAETDKNGLTVEGDFDFRIVDLASATRGVTLQASVKANPTSHATLIGCSLASSKGSRTYSPFTVSLTGKNRTATSSTPIQLRVTMTTKYYGRAEDRLELVFQDTRLRTQFMIARTLRVHVGSQSDHNDLKPRSPYTPKKRTARQPETEVVPGELAPSMQAIPYIGKLPPALIPSLVVRTLSSGTTKEIIARMQKVYLPQLLNSDGYGKHFKHLLWAEEFQMERDLEHYDMPNAKLTRYNSYYYLDVPGLAEKRPSVLVGDRILVQRSGSAQGHWFEGGVHVVRKEEVGLKFHRSFTANPSDRFLVRFKLNRYPVRRQHQALDSAFTQDRVLFPAPQHLRRAIPQGVGRTYNPTIATNPRQLQAVTSIARAPAGSVPFVIFGPPGTGKTVTMVEAIRQILDSNPRSRILACAPSNSAADLIAVRLTALGTGVLFRAYAPSRSKEQVPHELLPFTYRNANGHFSVPTGRIKLFRVIVTTCISANIVSGIGIPRGHYSHIFVDEAGQATEPEAMVAIKSMADNNTNAVLCGDPKQLGPIIRSTVARTLGLEVSFIERLMKREIYDEVEGYGKSVVKLTKNYRSHQAILKFPNERFYGGDLEPCANPQIANLYVNSSHVVSARFPIVLHSISGKDDREAASPSFFNIDEVTAVKSIVQKLRSDRRIRITDNDIGVIAPYHAQVLKLRTAFRSFADSVKVGSVEEFQGQERKVIIVSTVRSSREFVEYDLRHTLGFVANPRRFNVAVTRAQSLLIIVGDPNVLSLDPLWRSFMNYVYENGGWTGPEPSWDTEEPVDEAGGFDVAVREKAKDDMNAFSRMMEALTLNGVSEEGDGDDVNVDRPWVEME
ncbi:hypothetical protein V5O48_009828 [Marasmius crinis-equi]|uniref:RNA helicase n=1 Tax=Marasmius crinis-equi TaxID=585013 RepID=A0ABR3FA45_9AGAR